MSNTREEAASILDTISGFGSLVTGKIPGTAGQVIGGVFAAAGLVSDLLRLGEDPIVSITEIRSSLPDFNAAMGRIHERAKKRDQSGG
jgi:hypothetical protein